MWTGVVSLACLQVPVKEAMLLRVRYHDVLPWRHSAAAGKLLGTRILVGGVSDHHSAVSFPDQSRFPSAD